MALVDDLSNYVAGTFKSVWEKREGLVVPEPKNLKATNDAVEFNRATVLYADLSGSTTMVDNETPDFAAEIYKNFLYCAARLISESDGTITAYDGDRIMGVFVGDSQSTNAARCALKINHATLHIINPAIALHYPLSNFKIRHVTGIDTSSIRVAKTGVRVDNDLVWVGRAANYAAKLTEDECGHATWITADVFDLLHDDVKFSSQSKELMWKGHKWNAMKKMQIYGSTWSWQV